MLLSALAVLASPLAFDVPPDVGLWEERMADAYVGTTMSSENPPNVRAIRMSSVSINRGPGRLELRGGEVQGDRQRVYQRVWRSDGTTYDRPAGWFVYHSAHGHIHFEDWTVFRLRERLSDGSVGPVIRTGAKTSFCILELATWDSSLPGYNDPPAYSSCGQVQGLRPGRADVYSSGLNGQYIEIVGVPDGVYWLEAEIDPDNLVLEALENNNVIQIPFAIGPPPAVNPDPYEDNDSIAIVNGRPEGGVNSPNLGLVLQNRRIERLSMDDPGDYYKVRLHAMGPGDYIKMGSPWLRQGNLNLQLLNSSGTLLRQATGAYNYEQISLNGLPAGTYFIHVVRSTTTNNPDYFLEIEPGGNAPPNITVTKPQAPYVWVEYAHETFPVAWSGTDPDGDPKYASLFMDRNRVFGPSNEMIPGYQDLPGNSGEVNVNTVGLGLGRWWVFVRASDGAAFNDVWAPGYVGIFMKGDCTFDGISNKLDVRALQPYYPTFQNLPEGWSRIFDMDEDGDVDIRDWKILNNEIRR